ncbi:MAG: hypothetical protein C5B46_05845 [Proteobacteria bacterium]|nr:MAG: hypothetical protein C5B46_05845 [Pseudomonadota bacterium]
MTTAAFSMTAERPNLLRPILVGGAIAGTFDIVAAFITFGMNSPKAIAGGLLGRQAFQGGAAVWILGVFLHFFIAFSAATIYCMASRRLEFLKEHFLVCGIFYGIAIYLVMNLVVLPLCALHITGPYQLRALLQGLIVHMFLIGLPISYSLRKLS